MPESIEHNARMIGRIFEPYYDGQNIYYRKRSLYSNRTVNNSNRTIRKLTVLLEYIELFCHVPHTHFEEQRFTSTIYHVPITANLLAKHGK